MTDVRRTCTCCCGACRIEVEGDPTLNGVCHCNDCRRRTGSAFGWSAYFADAQIVGKEGPFSEYRVGAETPTTRYFCANCGSTLMWKADAADGQTGLAGGAFVDPPLPDPSVTASSDKQRHWVTLPGNWPALS